MKVLVIGLGSIAQKHINALKILYDNIDFYALRSDISSKKIVGVNDIYSYSEISNINPYFCIISNPTGAHLKTLQKIIASKLPLFIEKPLFNSIGSDEQYLVNKIMSSDVSNYVACNLRFLDSLTYMKNALSNERVNEVNVYCGSYLPDWRPTLDYKKSYSANKELGGGVHLDLIHELDYTYWLFGEPMKTTSFFSHKSSLDINAFDYANYLWEYKDFNVNIVLNYYRKSPKRTVEIVTEKNVFSIDLLKNEVYKDSMIIYKSDQIILDTYISQMDFFINKVINNNETFNTVEEAYKILNLCLNY